MTSQNNFLANVAGSYPDYLRDESRHTGTADSISFPKSEEEIRSQLAELNSRKIPVTVQGARTGITGGAVPHGGHILNLSHMSGITGLSIHPAEDAFILSVQPGVLLSDLRLFLEAKKFDITGWSEDSKKALEDLRSRKQNYFFPPDPTETSASIGGMVSCNASGARSFFYGPTRGYIENLRVVLADGSILILKRGNPMASGRSFAAVTDSGREISGVLPSYNMPNVKNASGYFVRDNMDLLDLFIGSEGTLGVVSEIGIKLIPAPAVTWGIMVFFPSEEIALSFVRSTRTTEPKPVALEFFNNGSLNLLRTQKDSNPAFSDLPAMPPAGHTAIYVEYQGPDEQTVEKAVIGMSEIINAVGGDTDATWMASDQHSLTDLKDFRHALPEIVNLQIDERRKKEPALTKLSTDLAVPDDRMEEVMQIYSISLSEAGLENVIFGHIGNNHVHVNIIPNTMDDYQRGKELYMKWAASVVMMEGSVSAEHGIGKLKTNMLRAMFGDEGIRQMKNVKACFDPGNILNPGNLFA